MAPTKGRKRRSSSTKASAVVDEAESNTVEMADVPQDANAADETMNVDNRNNNNSNNNNDNSSNTENNDSSNNKKMSKQKNNNKKKNNQPAEGDSMAIDENTTTTTTTTTPNAQRKKRAAKEREKVVEQRKFEELRALIDQHTQAHPIEPHKVKVHHCRFFEWMPEAIVAICFSPDGERFAVARTDSNIEIWKYTPRLPYPIRLEKVIAGDGAQIGLRSLVWVATEDPNDWDDDEDEAEGEEDENETQTKTQKTKRQIDRLFSAGLNGYIIEWDLTRMTKKNVVQSFGGAIWDLAVNDKRTQLAVACEDACVRLFDISQGSIEYKRAFPKHKDRVLGVAWHPVEDELWSSSNDGVIHRYNLETGMDAYRITSEDRTSLWSIKVLRDYTLVTGNSKGQTQFWDGVNGVLLQSFKEHRADVLAVVASDAGDAVFSTGIDHKVSLFVRIADDNQSKWVYSDSHRSHTHDIRALALHEDVLLSGGVDTQITVMRFSRSEDKEQQTLEWNYKISQKNPSMKVPPYQPIHFASFATNARLVLLRFSRALQVWRIGDGTLSQQSEKIDEEDEENRTQLMVDIPNELVAELHLKGRNLRCSAISRDGKYIACSDSGSVRIFRFNVLSGAVKKLKPNTELTPAHLLTFSPDSSKLIIATQDSLIQVYDIENDSILKTFGAHQGELGGKRAIATITQLTVSDDGKWIGSLDTLNRLNIFDLETLKHHAILPTIETPITALAFQPKADVIAVGTEDHHLFMLDLHEKHLTDWSKENSLRMPVTALQMKGGPMFHIAFNPAEPKQLLLCANDWVEYVHLDKLVINIASVWGVAYKFRRYNFQHIYSFRPLIGLAFLPEGNELVAIERPWLNIMQSLPNPLFRPRYRT
eukprot:TRINITY_DN8652_c0_g1_i1.p2 TRINITY_DN8652_c0_g1~~TRINITY_DN8652_c0_g1_i1.p2  ORF type:complete len:875 (-),score=212.31 TRINITY_DN8652_c0_g1_i1:56-2680(-)